MNNLLLQTDSYKQSHWKQYPPGTTQIYSYFESRGGEYPEVVFFGLQYILKRYLEGIVVTQGKIEEAEKICALHFGSKDLFNKDGWNYILDICDGKLPLSIKAVPEGTVVPTHNVMITVENTDPCVPFLTNFVETLLVQTWYPSTVATLSRHIKQLINRYLEITGDPALVDFKLHDFGFRGVSSTESAGIGGCAHLVNFKGTDTMAALLIARDYYHCEMAGFSIPAAEHSTMTAWGKDHEVDAFRNMLRSYPKGTVAVVSDQYDIYKACADLWGTQLKQEVLERDGVLVIRPDSGNPPEVVLKVISILGEHFGYTKNDKGYKVLNNHVRVIQGDGVDEPMIEKVLKTLELNRWSTDNIAFGMGGGLLQKLHRDTQKFAFKCSSAVINGEQRLVFKTPVTDPGKNSKAGRLKLVISYGVKSNGTYITVPEWTDKYGTDQLVEVFRNGKLLKDYTLDEIRERAKI
jgi:nicotinamide phosphoribosyltransferase